MMNFKAIEWTICMKNKSAKMLRNQKYFKLSKRMKQEFFKIRNHDFNMYLNKNIFLIFI